MLRTPDRCMVCGQRQCPVSSHVATTAEAERIVTGVAHILVTRECLECFDSSCPTFNCHTCRDTGIDGKDDATGDPYFCECAAGSREAWRWESVPV